MLFEMARSMQALSPFHIALREARRMARHHLHFEEGGAVPHEGRVVDQNDDGDFLLPPDVDPMVVALAINEKLRDGQTTPGLGDDPMRLLERRAGGRVVVAGHHLLRLGDGRFDRGRQFMHNLIASIRRRH
jgi:hypothetical protein